MRLCGRAPRTLANSPRSILVLYNRTLLAIVREVSDYIMHTQVFNFLHRFKLEISCLNIKYGGAGFLLDIQMKYAIFENYRYMLDQEEI